MPLHDDLSPELPANNEDTAQLPAIRAAFAAAGTEVPDRPEAKPCHLCGRDTTGRKRMKDHAGRYFCYDCGIIHSQQERRTRGLPCSECRRVLVPEKLYGEGSVRYCERCWAERMRLAKDARQRERAHRGGDGFWKLVQRLRGRGGARRGRHGRS